MNENYTIAITDDIKAYDNMLSISESIPSVYKDVNISATVDLNYDVEIELSCIAENDETLSEEIRLDISKYMNVDAKRFIQGIIRTKLNNKFGERND